jgi:hypothetical protein
VGSRSAIEQRVKYCAFGHALESDAPLLELPPARDADAPRFSIHYPDQLDVPDALRWSVVWEAAGGQPPLEFARGAGESFLRLGLQMSARLGDRRIDLTTDSRMDPAAARHLLLDQVLPLALAHAGETVLHASAVRVDDAAVLFVGAAGSGKSTVAAALTACGASVLADDGAALDACGDDVTVRASYPGLRLWPDAAEFAGARGFTVASLGPGDKRRLIPAGGAPCPPSLPLAGVYSLRIGSPAGFERLSPRDAALELVRHAFTPDVATREAIVAQFNRATGWAARIAVWTAAGTPGFASLDAFARAIVAHVRRHHPSARLLNQ